MYRDSAKLHGMSEPLIKKKWEETEKCRDVVANNIPKVYDASKDLLLLARRELRFPIEESDYAKIMNERITAMKSNLDSIFEKIREEVSQRME